VAPFFQLSAMDSIEEFINVAKAAGGVSASIDTVIEGVNQVVEPIRGLLISTESLDTVPHRYGLNFATSLATYLARTATARMPALSEMESLADLYAAYAVYPMRLDLAVLTMLILPLSTLTRKKYKRILCKTAGISLCLSLIFPQQVFFFVHCAAAKTKGSLRSQSPLEVPLITNAKSLVESLPDFNKSHAQTQADNSQFLMFAVAGVGLLGTLFFQPGADDR